MGSGPLGWKSVSDLVYQIKPIPRAKPHQKEKALGRFSAPHAPVLQHEARAAGAADAGAEIVDRAPRIGPDPHLVEHAGAAAAVHGAEQARILVADDGA